MSISKIIKNEIGWWPFLFAFIMIVKVISINIPFYTIINYIALLVAFVFVIISNRKLDVIMMSLVLYIPLTIILAQPDSVFKSWGRYGAFILLLVCVSPLVDSEFAKSFRLKTLKATLFLCCIISIICFFCYFLGVNLRRTAYFEGSDFFITNTAGLFGGICRQSMELAPISGIAVLFLTYVAMITGKWQYWLLTFMAFGSLLFAASRSSLIATICGELIFFQFYSYEKNMLIRRAVPILFIAVLLYPVWGGAMDGINAKNGTDISEGINIKSREQKWIIRMEEFYDSPIWGIGFVSVSNKDRYDHIGGIIEPGSSWLAVLSMTGIVGFFLFCNLFYRGLKSTVLRERGPDSSLLGALLVFVGIHMIAEGHIFSAGAFLCFLVWLIIGCASDYVSDSQV